MLKVLMRYKKPNKKGFEKNFNRPYVEQFSDNVPEFVKLNENNEIDYKIEEVPDHETKKFKTVKTETIFSLQRVNEMKKTGGVIIITNDDLKAIEAQKIAFENAIKEAEKRGYEKALKEAKK